MSGTVQFNHSSGRLNIPTCRLTTGAGGYLDIKGDWDKMSSSWTANVVINSIPASSILADDWKKHVQGEVSGGVDLRGEQGRLTHVAGLVRLQNGMLSGLPVLDRLALFCDSSRFRQLALPDKRFRPVPLYQRRLACVRCSDREREPDAGGRLAGNRG